MVKQGIPIDVVFELDDTTRTAWAIIASEQEGSEFDWSTMKFKE